MEKQILISEKLQGFIVSPDELLEKMAEGEFKFYQPVDMKALEKEALDEGVSSVEFRQMIFANLRNRFIKIWDKQ